MSNLDAKYAWAAIDAQVKAIERSAHLYAAYLSQGSAKTIKDAEESIYQSCVTVWRNISLFKENFLHRIPKEVVNSIDLFETESANLINNKMDSLDFNQKRVMQIKLIGLAAEVTYLLNDTSDSIRTSTEMAFMHIQRLIVVDEKYRQEWMEAFKKGEIQCEKLGGVHLLWHGILAFKVDASGGRSDLVFPSALRERDIAATQGLVLTEWKKASGDGKQEFIVAQNQTNNYASGIVGAVELKTHRYLVVVTEKNIQPPDDLVTDGITFRHINIAVNPDNPSRQALAASR